MLPLSMKSLNFCTPIEEIYTEEQNLMGIRISTGICYTVIFLVATFGNVAVLYGLMCRSIEMNVRNVFIWSLTLADVLVCTTSLPITAYHSHSRQWHLGSLMCKIVPLLQGSGIFITSFTLMAIAWDRYRLVCFPLSEKNLKLPSAIGLVILLWIFGFAFACPYGLSMNLESNYTFLSETDELIAVCGDYCEEYWPSEFLRIGFGIVTVVIQYIGPLLFCTICYLKIVNNLKTSQTKRLYSGSEHLKTQMSRRKRKVNRMIGAMLFSFIFAWLPFDAQQLFRDIFSTPATESLYHTLFTITHMIAMTSLIWNPVIYCYCNEQFRSLFSCQTKPTVITNAVKNPNASPNNNHHYTLVQHELVGKQEEVHL